MGNTKILLNDFEYFEPERIEEAVSILDKYGNEAKALAGGTDLLIRMKKGEIGPKYLVNIKGIQDLDYITEDDGLRIGTATTLRRIEKSQIVKEKYLVLFEAVKALGTVQVKNIGTIGGNICNASPAADTASALLSLGARVKISSSQGGRTIPLEEFFTGPRETALSPNELLTEIQVPHLPGGIGSAFLKISRVSADLAKINAAAVIEREEDVCKSCRIALGAVAPTPIRIKKAEKMLNGKKFEEGLVREVTQIVSEEIKPISDVRSTAEYRREVSKSLVEDVLKIAWERA